MYSNRLYFNSFIIFLFIQYVNCLFILYDNPLLNGRYEAVSGPFLGKQGYYSVTAKLKYAEPFDACAPLKNCHQLEGAVVLVKDGTFSV